MIGFWRSFQLALIALAVGTMCVVVLAAIYLAIEKFYQNPRIPWVEISGWSIIFLSLASITVLILRWCRTKKTRVDLPLTEDAGVLTSTVEEPATITAPPAVAFTAQRVFMAQLEAYTSAGPRKSSRDFDKQEVSPHDLCEDAAGVLAIGSSYLWWLSDGTSNGSYLPPVGNHPGLTTRMFARDLGEAFVNAQIKASTSAEAADDLMFEDLRSLWYKRLNRYIGQLVETGAWEKFVDRAPQNSDGSLLFRWSSTFMGGIIYPGATEATMILYQAGDSGALILRHVDGSPLPEIILPTKDRISVRALIYDGILQVDVFAGEIGQLPTYRVDNLYAFFAMSDGLINGDLAAYLPNLQGLAATRSVADLRAGLLQRRDKSFDDKTLVIGRMLGAL